MNLSNNTLSLNHREYLVKNIEVVDIEISTACNRKCSYCPNSKYDNALIENNSLMKEEVFSKIVKDLGNERYNGEICLQRYNEPLIDSRIHRLVEIASKSAPNATITIYSNGDYLTVSLYKKLLEAGLNKFTITHHGTKPSQGFLDVETFRKENPDKMIFKSKKMDNSGKFYNRGGEITLLSDQPKNFFCKAINCVTINTKGDVILSCNDYHSRYLFGNAGIENVLDICLGKEFQNVKIEAITGLFSREICKICMYGDI